MAVLHPALAFWVWFFRWRGLVRTGVSLEWLAGVSPPLGPSCNPLGDCTGCPRRPLWTVRSVSTVASGPLGAHSGRRSHRASSPSSAYWPASASSSPRTRPATGRQRLASHRQWGRPRCPYLGLPLWACRSFPRIPPRTFSACRKDTFSLHIVCVVCCLDTFGVSVLSL